MRTDSYFKSGGSGMIHCCRWTPSGEIQAIVQIVHGIAEHVERYHDFATYLNDHGILVVAEDHMGHGKSVGEDGVKGYFHGGWFCAVEDTYRLLQNTMAEFPGVPYVLMGHSMGSFMTRTLLAKYPDSGISAAIICGTGWQPKAVLTAGIQICQMVCKRDGETEPSAKLENIVFGSYNKRVEHPKTPFDWLSRDSREVEAYIADPMCGFVSTAGLLREMLIGISYIEQPEDLRRMRKDLPVFLIAGGDDPVGSYGKGVVKTAEAFRKSGLTNVKVKLYPLGRHEILNEINKREVYQDIFSWICLTLHL